MFKLESYITPILLSYVNKFIKNFKPEDSQLSLWGGEASFQNLDLRLEVLEEELQLPFSFVSGHIHELLIHVPWTKLTSEPIKVTINTIECILKLHGEDIGSDGTASNTANSGREVKRRAKRQPEHIAAPPGYVQTLANKIVSNITINCTNLIVKYVEEDIVMSMNVKNLTYQSANQRWEPEFSDYLPTQLILRKLINMTDVTVCLDKRNASGKIDSYQEPLLYKCSLTMHLFRMYSSPSAQQAYVTRLDVFCQKMMFNVSEVQVPMMMRLMLLGLALQNREIGPNKVTHSDPDTHVDDEEEGEDNDAAGSESWAGWAWSFVPSLPVGWNEDWDEDENKNRINTFHFGFYIQELGFSLRIGESGVSERGVWKTKLEPFLTLTLNGCVLDMVMASKVFFNSRMGVCSVKLEPVSQCCCGAFESDANQEAVYLLGGSVQDQYIDDSLFSPTSAENQGQNKEYCLSWDVHLETMTEAVLLEKTPAIAIDYLYVVDLPEDFALEKVIEMGLDLEYSNLAERSLCRTVVGPLTLRVNSGLVHRMGRLLQAASLYDYQPYSVPKPDERRELLPTVTTEEYDSLEENIPMRIHQFTVFQPFIVFQLANHPMVPQTTRRKMSSVKHTATRNLPAVQVGCQCLDAKLIRPMYSRRLVRTACQLPHLPEHMFNCCHVRSSVRVGRKGTIRLKWEKRQYDLNGGRYEVMPCNDSEATINTYKLTAELIESVLGFETSLSQGTQSHILAKSPENVSFDRTTLLLPYLWTNADLSHRDDVWKLGQLNLTTTKPQLLLTQRIVASLFSFHVPTDALSSSSLIRDAISSEDIVVLETVMENCSWRAVVTSSTKSYTLLVTSIQAQVSAIVKSMQETKSDVKQYQVLTTHGDGRPFISGCFQWPVGVEAADHPPLLALCVSEVNLNMSPLLCVWILYQPVLLRSKAYLADWTNQRQTPSRKISEHSLRQSSIEKAATAQESAHSSSDRDVLPPLPTVAHNSTISLEPPVPHTDQTTSTKQGVIPEAWLVEWYHVWINVIVNIEVGRWHVTIPFVSSSSLSEKSSVLLELPILHVRSATPPNKQICQLQFFPATLPVNLPQGVWKPRNNNFPWNVTFTDCSARTFIKDEKLDLLRPFSVNCTVAISNRFTNGEQLTALGVCIHNDTTPVYFAASRDQIQLLCGVFVGLSAVGKAVARSFVSTEKSSMSQTSPSNQALLSPTTVSETASASEVRHPEKGWNMVPERDSSESLKLTMWLQWTLTRLTASFYHSEADGSVCKLVIDWEDFMSSLDLQQVYCKLKLKVTGVSVCHYTRCVGESEWRLSPVHGVVLKCREGSVRTDAGQVSTDEGCGFLNVTFTRAKCRNAHSRWGAGSTSAITGKRFADGKVDGQRSDPTSCFISEVVAKMQPIDVILAPSLLVQMGLFIRPLWQMPVKSDLTPTNLTSCSLPLLYLDLQALRIILPVVGSKHGKHDTYIFQVDSIVLSPHAENPLLRTPLRPDIYHMAEQARILTVPGSEVEDRQHELTVSEFAIRTGEWREIDLCQKSSSATSSLRTMSENPALVWNTLDQNSPHQDGETLVSQVAQPKPRFSNVLLPVKLIVVAAPAVIFHERVLICGHALEINAVNGLEIVLTCSQLNLGVSLLVETRKAVELIQADSSAVRPSVPSFMVEALLRQSRFQHATPTEFELSMDSGVDTGDLSSVETSNFRSNEIGKSGRKYSCFSVSGRVDGVVGSYSTHSAPTAACTRPILCEKDNYTSYSTMSVDYSAPPDFSSLPRSSEVVRDLNRLSHFSKESRNVVPFDILLTGSKIVVMLYQDQPTEDDVRDHVQDASNMTPLLYALLLQPYISFSLVSRNHKMQASLYNSLIKLGSNISFPRTDPVLLNDTDFPLVLVDTKKGDADPRTGILPAFFSLQWTSVQNKPAVIVVDLGRPTKLVMSNANLDCVIKIQKVLMSNFESAISMLFSAKSSPERSARGGVEYLRETLVDINCVTLKTVQLMLVLQTEGNGEATGELNVSSSTSTITCVSGSRWGMAAQNVERISFSASVVGVSVALSYRKKRHFLLEPCSFDAKIQIMWPMWFLIHKLPVVQMSVSAGCVNLALGTDHLHSMLHLWNSYKDYLSTSPSTRPAASSPLPPQSLAPSDDSSNETGTDSVDTEQHYTDDLRAGAFQFLDASENMSRDGLPLPYQCVFWESGPAAMAWRYPQPRVITHMDVFPVPFKVPEDDDYETSSVVCSLQYWSECHAAYQPLATFLLSENERSQLTLTSDPGPAVSTAWRILVAGNPSQDVMDSEQDCVNNVVSPRVLAACIRINSFFSANLVPWFQGSFNIALLKVSMYNHLSNHVIRPMPKVLKEFQLDSSLPTTHSFLWLALNKASFFSSVWPGGRLVSECNSMVRAECLDYATFTEQSLVEAFSMQGAVSMTQNKHIDLSMVTKPVAIRYGPSAAHTCAVSAQLWIQEWLHPDEQLPQVIVSRYAICNDTALPLRFGQVGTEEDIPLLSRQCHFYAWRTHCKLRPQLRVALTGRSQSESRSGSADGGLAETKKVWSRPFSIDTCGTQRLIIQNHNKWHTVLIVKIEALSAMQKKIIFSGQLVVCNQLSQTLEIRVMRPLSETFGIVVPVESERIGPSFFIDKPTNDSGLCIRVRFSGATLWTGDIPLTQNTRGNHPWLVKVPLQEKSQSRTVWCRVLREVADEQVQILVLISPLYAVKSFLPGPTQLLIDTPTLGTHTSLNVEGYSSVQELGCLGSLEHEHQLRVQVQPLTETLPSQSFKLSYDCFDQSQLSGNTNKLDFDLFFKEFEESKKTIWPLPEVETARLTWATAGHHDSDIKVTFAHERIHAGTLMVEIRPWILFLNVLSKPIQVFSGGCVVCTVPPKSAVVPPRLEGTFQLGLQLSGDDWHMTESLQLAKADRGKSFYMPRITGLIPIEGHIATILNGQSMVSLLNMKSQIHEDTRIISIRPSFVICNNTSHPVRVTALAVCHVDQKHRIVVPTLTSPSVQAATFVVQPDAQNRGYPIEKWLLLKTCEAPIIPYVAFSSVDGDLMSCPIMLNQNKASQHRSRFSVPLPQPCVIPGRGPRLATSSLVLCVVDRGEQTFATVMDEPHPQLIIHNQCNFALTCAQGVSTGPSESTECKILPDAAHFDWFMTVPANCQASYSLPTEDETFPLLPTGTQTAFIVLAAKNLCTDSNGPWSGGVRISESQEQYVNLPNYGDVKVRLWLKCHTMNLSIEAVSKIEISVRDIRSRLSAAPTSVLKTSANFYEEDASGTSTGRRSTSSATTSEEENANLNEVPSSPDCSRSSVTIAVFLQSLSVTLTTCESADVQTEIACLCMDRVGFTFKPILASSSLSNVIESKVNLVIGDFQLDNQMFEQGGYDFPVVVLGQGGESKVPQLKVLSVNTPALQLIEEHSRGALVAVTLTFERTYDADDCRGTVTKMLHLSIGPLTAFIEDTFVLQLNEHAVALFSPSVMYWAESDDTALAVPTMDSPWVVPPLAVCWETKVLSQPLRLASFTVDPLWLLISVHSSVRMYIALDRSPLQFTQFSRRSICTTSYNLGHALTMHYLSGAIFGAGWVVGSLELIGSPGGFARTLGSGLKDFISLPYHGILQGPWGFLVGVTHGSASLMKHFTAGTLNSVTKMASSVARNLDRLTLDEEHLRRTEEMRRIRPQGVTQGLVQGLTGLGISLLGAVGGLAHHPLQCVMSGPTTPRGLMTGVGRGLVGVFTKPLSGAADFVAMTGQGLLQGAGWTDLPQKRQSARPDLAKLRSCAPLKYHIKMFPTFVREAIANGYLLIIEATRMRDADTGGIQGDAVTLALTTKALVVFSATNDVRESIFSLEDLAPQDSFSTEDDTRLVICFRKPPPQVDMRIWEFLQAVPTLSNPGPPTLDVAQDVPPTSLPAKLPLSLQILEYRLAGPDVEDTANPNLNLSGSEGSDNGGINEPFTTSPGPSSLEPSPPRPPLVFLVNPQVRSRFELAFYTAHRQYHGVGFPVL